MERLKKDVILKTVTTTQTEIDLFIIHFLGKKCPLNDKSEIKLKLKNKNAIIHLD